MAVERIYRCNFCQQEYPKGDSRLIGVYWSGSGGGSKFDAADAVKVENHICVRCVECIVNIANTTLKGRF